MNKGVLIFFLIGLLIIIGCNYTETNTKILSPKKIYEINIKFNPDSLIVPLSFDSIQLIQFWTINCKQFNPDLDSTTNEISYFRHKTLPKNSNLLIDSLVKLTNIKNTGPESTCEKSYQFIGYLKGEAFELLTIDDCDMTKYGYLSQKGRKILAKICSDCKLTYKPCWSDRYYSK
jgi:hypothetical protein